MKSFLLKILLSATLFNLSFFFPDYLGWTIIFSFIFLWLGQFLLRRNVFVKNFYFGFFWGVLVFTFHFIWLFELLLNKSGATFILSVLIYLIIILYASFSSGLWFGITKFICQLLGKSGLLLSTFTYFYFLQNYSTFFLGKIEGYPFLNPFIPLARYKWFMFLYFFIFNGHFNFPDQQLKNSKIFYLKPVVKSFNQISQDLSASVVGQKIYYQLTKLDLEKYAKKYKNLIIVSPETAYPFPLNKNLENIKLWNCVLPKNSHFFIGSQREESGEIFQTVYWIQGCRIIDSYDKNHRMAFTEKIFSIWKRFNWTKNLFLKNKLQFQKGKININLSFFKISEELQIIPQICSELFMGDNLVKKLEKNNPNRIIFFFVNDSWFICYLQKIMKNFTILKSAQMGLPVVYITHSNIM